MEKVLRLQAEGIMCTGCVEDMQTVLRNTEGINDAKVSFSDGTIEVKFDPEVIDARKVFLKVNSLGFKTKVLEEAG
jgi:copper chaperone CopZ